MFATTCIHAYGRIGRDSRPITHGYHHAAAYGGAVPTETAQILGIGPRVRDMHLMDGLERGYLPQEIPPCFTSKDFASKARSLARIDPKSWTLPAKFSIARAGGVRRSAEIPNPFAQLLLIELCEKNWTTLQRITARSEISLSRPVRGNHVRSMAYRHPISEWGRQLVGRMPGGRVTLKTDISQFYPSIYTHAVDWAIRGKRKAKARLREIGLGPDLDLRLRNSRGGQTIGLSVGPDTSWLVAELILARIDEDLLKKFPRIAPRCARFGDDMTVYAESEAEAHAVLAAYQRFLGDYELSLNPIKVSVTDGLLPVEAGWVRQLRSHRYRSRRDDHLTADIIDLYQLALEQRQDNPSDGVLSYALKRCDPFPAGKSSWPAFRDLILATISLEPSALRHAYEVLVFGRDHGLSVDTDRVEEILNSACMRHATLDHGYEVSWLLYLLRELNLPLDSAAGREVAQMGDVSSQILLQDMLSRSKVLRASVDTNTAVKRAEVTGALSSGDWLLAYEFRHNKWARPCKWDSVPSWVDAHRANVEFFVRGTARKRRVLLKRRRPTFLPSWVYPGTTGSSRLRWGTQG